MVQTKLFDGEQYLMQTVDEKLAFTTHRLIQNPTPWSFRKSKHILLEDIQDCEVKVTGKPIYLILGSIAALFIYYDNSFVLLGSFFLMLYIMTRGQRIHITATDTSMVLPLQVEEQHFNNLLAMVRQARKAGKSKINFSAEELSLASAYHLKQTA
ncbi:hypothetical protein [Pontibacter arcticus]|uniref:Uncharacterized protein n=1 Tax=Pontibacter arcticus TaxID=2080288 RepID=A0A364RI45_9BACT|nr:hypothetical protein [Pontibacter arcticus]RAU83961.1 hypothetical protein DP923_02545 [Pontibacter arcticus]